MIPSRNSQPLDVHTFRVPYLGAVRAMAYAGFDFETVKDRIIKWGFYFPDYFKSPDSAYSRLQRKFLFYQDEAIRTGNRYGRISTAKSISEGVYPLRDWLVRDQDNLPIDPSDIPREERIIHEVLSDIYSPELRRAICVMDWKGYQPHDIDRTLQTDPRAPVTGWTIDHINYFLQFFWKIDQMTQRDWDTYGSMQKIQGNNPHAQYIMSIVNSTDKMSVSWHGYPVAELDDIEMLEILKARQFRDALDPDKEFRLRAGRALRETILAKQKIEYDRNAIPQAPGENILADVELVIQQARDKQNTHFAMISEIDGDVSDPRDTSFGKDEYLDQG